jgi:aminopeptidase YwaD
MMLSRLIPGITIFLCAVLSASASLSAPYIISPDSIRTHITVLSSDSLEGREIGEVGEQKAARYIASVLEAAGLQSRGDSGSYLQAFDFIKRIDLGPDNILTLNGQTMTPGAEFSPLHHSANTTFSFDSIIDVGYGIVTEDSSRNDYAGKDVSGKAVLIRRHSPEPADSSDTVNYDRYSDITNKIITAIDHHAAAVFLITPPTHDDTLIGMDATHVTPKDIPVVFLRRAGLQRLGLDLASPALVSVTGTTDLIRVRDTGYNVVGYLPGLTDSTIIIGAHYDHLGWGTSSSRYLGKEKMIHRGADDNGSGVAAMLELARNFASRGTQLRHSMLFIAFSGEESGLLGSSHFVRNWTVDRNKAYMMINIDMIGRLNEQEKGLIVMGTGTCAQFKTYFDSLLTPPVKMTFSESGSGPSDHAAFYNDSIPVLNFFTGAHQDYHTPDDVVDKIDIGGVLSVTNLIAGIIDHFDQYPGALAFQRTKDSGTDRGRGNFSVTLGIMPDFISEVKGLRVDGVSPGRPADNAGLLKGDIVIRLGEYTIGDIYDYMNALGKFRLGNSTEAVIIRGDDTLTVTIEFK